MKCHLGGRNNIEPSIDIHITIGTEGLHHCLLIGLRMVSLIYHIPALRKYLINIAVLFFSAGT